MKILFVISSLSHGGAERVLVNIANHLSSKHEISIATFANTPSFYLLDEKVNSIILDLMKPSRTIIETCLNTFKRLRILSRTIKTVNPDVIISFMTHTNILSILAAKWVRHKIIISERTIYNFYSSWLLNALKRIIYPWCDYLVTQTLQDSNNYNFVANITTIYNPIIIPSLSITSQKEKIILAVGRLDKQKGFDKLIKAFSLLPQNNWELWIVGEGQERGSLEKQISELKMQNIKLLGIQKNIFDYYAIASLFVLPSEKEGFPNALLEAMSFGCACISFDCPYGPREIITDKVNGILIENQNVEQLTQAIYTLINDAHTREMLSQEAIKIRQQYAIEHIVEKWEEIIGQVIER